VVERLRRDDDGARNKSEEGVSIDFTANLPLILNSNQSC
jgi:hypothetical protein